MTETYYEQVRDEVLAEERKAILEIVDTIKGSLTDDEGPWDNEVAALILRRLDRIEANTAKP